MMRRIWLLCLPLVAVVALLSGPAWANDCNFRGCGDGPRVVTGDGELTALYFEANGTLGYASNNAPSPQPYKWRLRKQCQLTDPNIGGCAPNQATCDAPAGRLVSYYIVQRQRVVLPDRSPVDNSPPPAEAPIGSGFGLWTTAFAGCVDVTDLNPPPSPGE